MNNIVLVNDIVTWGSLKLTDIDGIYKVGNFSEIGKNIVVTIQSPCSCSKIR